MARRVQLPGPTVMDTLRSKLAEQVSGGRTLYHVAKSAGLDYMTVSTFFAGRNGLTGPSVDRLAYALGLEIRPMGEKQPSGREVALAV